jgi:hypothetical protein
MKKSYDAKRRSGNMMYGPTKHENTHKTISQLSTAHRQWIKDRITENAAFIAPRRKS